MTLKRWILTGMLAAAFSTAPTALFDPSPAYAKSPAPQTNSTKRAEQNPRSSEHTLLLQADEIAEAVGQIRGLELKQSFTKGVKNRDELRSVLLEKLDDDVSDTEIENESNVFKRLGIFGPEIQYKQMMVDMLTEQIAGFYDQQEKELYIMEGIPLDLQRPAMAHEIFHAIQDQHYDIGKMLSPFSNDENGDFALARMALIEGDATVLLIDFSMYDSKVLPQENANSVADIPLVAAMIMELGFDDIAAMEQMIPTAPDGSTATEMPSAADTVLASTPLFIRELLLFPYIGGMRFVIMSRSGNQWSDVDDIYLNAPVSTEQIMHPERYFDGDEPIHIVYDPTDALQGYTPIYDTVFGEFQMLLWLKTHLGSPALTRAPEPSPITANEAAKGWGGDRLMAFEDADGNVLTTHLSAWDSLEDATEFFDLQKHILQHRFADATITEASGAHGRSLCIQHVLNGRSERIYLEQWDDMILQIEGAPSTLSDDGHETNPTTYALRERIWRTFRRTPFQTVYKNRLKQAQK